MCVVYYKNVSTIIKTEKKKKLICDSVMVEALKWGKGRKNEKRMELETFKFISTKDHVTSEFQMNLETFDCSTLSGWRGYTFDSQPSTTVTTGATTTSGPPHSFYDDEEEEGWE